MAMVMISAMMNLTMRIMVSTSILHLVAMEPNVKQRWMPQRAVSGVLGGLTTALMAYTMLTKNHLSQRFPRTVGNGRQLCRLRDRKRLLSETSTFQADQHYINNSRIHLCKYN